MMDFLIVILALAGLWIGAELIIKGALQIARHYELSELFIGLTILAIGTDLPELFVVVSAAISRLSGIETSDLVMGQTVGSATSQIGFVLGLAGLFGTITVLKRELLRDGVFMMFSIALLFLLGIDGILTKTDGLILLIAYLIYMVTVFREERALDKAGRAPSMDLIWSVLSVVGGFILLIFASELTIDTSLRISEEFGVQQSLIGILLVGLGTSLPELATTITAIRQKAGKLAVGNLIGSNIYDILVTVGVGSMISGFVVSSEFEFIHIPALFIISLISVIFLTTKRRFGKKEAVAILSVYCLYYFTTLFLGLT